jgi:hypothetical protein
MEDPMIDMRDLMHVIIDYAVGALLVFICLSDPTKLRHLLFKIRGRDTTGEPARKWYI